MKRNGIQFIMLLSLLTGLSAIGMAQETPVINTDSAKCISDNLYSIQFYLVNGLSVAGKKQISNNSALRLHFDFSTGLISSETDQKWTNKSNYDTSETKYNLNQDGNSQSVVISLQYLYYPYQSKFFDFFVGCGPKLGYSRTFNNAETKRHDSLNHSLYLSEKTTKNYYLFGVLLVSGFETQITNYLNLFAEYHLTIGHIWNDSETINKNFDQDGNLESSYIFQNDQTSWNLTLSKIQLGLAVNF